MFDRRVSLGAIGSLLLTIIFGTGLASLQSGQARAQYFPALSNLNMTVIQARGLAGKLHEFHSNGGTIDKNDYCKTIQDAKNILNQLGAMTGGLSQEEALAGYISTGGALPVAKSDVYNAGYDLADELAEEEKRVTASGVLPCPPPETTMLFGWQLGLQFGTNAGFTQTVERFFDTNATTNHFYDTGDPLAAGVILGYGFAPWANNILLFPYFSADYRPQKIYHMFPGGTYIGTNTNWDATAGIKFGIQTSPNLFLYGLAGASILNEDLKLNFGPAAISSKNTTIPGFALGAGVAFQPATLQQFGRPVTLFVEYQYTWWENAHYNQPAASPLFNYTFALNNSSIRGGIMIALNPISPSRAATFVTK